ncbi:MAG TPA: DUF559 domain-containing protein, partial [Longimicrobiaceae bacterium]|nr:DUF559 domain-containing protein [Longimicrobiaceae bacterium]
RRLRSEQTPAESLLWTALRGRQLDGLHFRRQHALDRFVLDFYCPAHKLCVEVDGDVHDGQADYDHARSVALGLRGIRVVRFRNEQVFENLDSVLHAIRAEIRPVASEPAD